MFAVRVYVFVLIASIIIISYCNTLELIPQRANVTYLNPKYVTYGRFYVTRLSRKSPYYMNVDGRTLHPWTNNVTFNFIFYEYLHNEYRRSFVELHFKFCDMINGEPFIGGMFKAHGVECPMRVGEYHLLNMTIAGEKFPNVFPIEKCKIEVDFSMTDTGEAIVKAYLYAQIKTTKKKKL